MVNIEKAKSIGGWMPEVELEWLAEQASKHYKILELGACQGRSTRVLCDNTVGQVYTVDNWNTPGIADWNTFLVFINNLNDHIISNRLVILHYNIDVAFEIIMGNDFKFDFVFIDADHNYNAVKEDIINSLKILEPGGLISGHDYNWEGVKKAADELLPDHKLHNNIWYTEVS